MRGHAEGCAKVGAWMRRSQGNAGLCGYIPPCLSVRIPSLNGTALIDPQDPARNPAGGSCDNTPPLCRPQDGCGCVCIHCQLPPLVALCRQGHLLHAAKPRQCHACNKATEVPHTGIPGVG